MTTLFKEGDFEAQTDSFLPWNIDCEALTEEDWVCLASLISKTYRFRNVVGISPGGMKLRDALSVYNNRAATLTLIVDDVLYNGVAMEREKKLNGGLIGNILGIVVFARVTPPVWVKAIFQLGDRWCQHGG